MEMMKRLVDRKVNELAMEMPNYDLEDGAVLGCLGGLGVGEWKS